MFYQSGTPFGPVDEVFGLVHATFDLSRVGVTPRTIGPLVDHRKVVIDVALGEMDDFN